MTCFHPLKGYRSRELGANGKRSIVFNPTMGYHDLPVTLPCGQCSGCRLERSRQWAIRCSHEASLHKQNSFITLTYNDANIPPDGSLNLRHFQLFIKRLRKKYSEKTIRFFHCGEYGEKLLRPHYHACLFGYDFPDKTLWKESNKFPLYRSKILEELWPMGFSIVGEVTFESAAYVARYVMKKVTGDDASVHYNKPYLHVDPYTGEYYEVDFDLKPEYTTMSRRPGVGSHWFDKYKSDVYPSDFIIMNNKKMRPPKFYDRSYELTNEKEFNRIRGTRIRASKKHAENQTPARLVVREKVQDLKTKRLIRKMEKPDDP